MMVFAPIWEPGKTTSGGGGKGRVAPYVESVCGENDRKKGKVKNRQGVEKGDERKRTSTRKKNGNGNKKGEVPTKKKPLTTNRWDETPKPNLRDPSPKAPHR